MKRACCIILAALLLFTAGCSAPAPTPSSSVPGYYGQGQTMTGGANLREAALSAVAVERQQEEVVLTMTFRQGEGESARVPAYEVESITAPARIAVRVQADLAADAQTDLESAGEFLGLFARSTEEGTDLYFQFLGQIAYKVSEEEGALVLRVRADDAQSIDQYHVKVPYNEENLAVTAESGLQPALCADGEHVYDLSAGFATIEEADALCRTLNDALEAAGCDETAEVIYLNSGAAPAYTEPVSRSELTMMGALKTDSGVVDGTLVATDARFLCWDPEGGMVMARPQVETTGDGTTSTYEEVWLYQLDGTRAPLLDTAFSSVQKAAYSPDTRYIALLEQSSGARLLYLYDRRDGGLLFLSAEGFGDYTSDFAWGQDGVLYAMSGSDTMQLMAYDPAVAEMGQEPLRAVEEREGGYGNVGEAGGIVYFNDEYGNVYAVDTATGTRELFEIADGFLLSPDGSRMLQIVYEDGENGSLATMYLCDLASGTRMQIAAQAALSDYAWSEDSRVLFYLVSNRDAEDAADYPVRLMRYSTVDGRTTDLGALASNSIFPGRTQDSILLMYYQDRDGLFYPITYQLSLTDLTDHAQDELVPTLE